MSGASRLSQESALLRPQLVGASVLYRLLIGYLCSEHLVLNLLQHSHPKTCNDPERWDNNAIEVASGNDIMSDILSLSRLSSSKSTPALAHASVKHTESFVCVSVLLETLCLLFALG